MRQAIIDTDIISLFLKNEATVVKNFKEYLSKFEYVSFKIITYYEILSGLTYRDAKKQLEAFLEFAEYCSILPLTKISIEISSEIYSNLRRTGKIIDDIDILIAGIAISNNLVLVTHNKNHFGRINGLELEDWFSI